MRKLTVGKGLGNEYMEDTDMEENLMRRTEVTILLIIASRVV
jgi:hypothetical protein